MIIEIPDSVVRKIQYLNAVTSWRTGNFTRIESAIDRAQALVSQLLMWAVLKEIMKEKKPKRLSLKPKKLTSK